MSGVSINVKTGEVTETTVEPVTVDMSGEARTIRDAALTACDWTQLPDVTLANAQAWLDYRQALRDVTLDPGWTTDPVGVVEALIVGRPV